MMMNNLHLMVLLVQHCFPLSRSLKHLMLCLFFCVVVSIVVHVPEDGREILNPQKKFSDFNQTSRVLFGLSKYMWKK